MKLHNAQIYTRSALYRSYTLALTRGVPPTMSKALTSNVVSTPFSFVHAKEQHETYLRTLRKIVPTVAIPADSMYPDCSFIEDTAVVVGYSAVLNRLGASSRHGEVDAIKVFLETLGISVTDMREIIVESEYNDIPTCDGGDVLLPVQNDSLHKRDIFVGISQRTNRSGFHVLEKVFSDMTVIPVPIPKETGFLHLKSFTTLLDETTLIMPTGIVYDRILDNMNAVERGYDILRLPSSVGCNVVSIHGHVIAPILGDDDIRTRTILEKACAMRQLTLHYIDSSEFEKFDGASTCKSLLLRL